MCILSRAWHDLDRSQRSERGTDEPADGGKSGAPPSAEAPPSSQPTATAATPMGVANGNVGGGAEGSGGADGGGGGSEGGAGGGAGGRGKDSGGKDASTGAPPSGGNARAPKYDFSHLSLEEIDDMLAGQQADFERDVGRLRKQYERRGRALRSARAAKEAAKEQTSSDAPAASTAAAS